MNISSHVKFLTVTFYVENEMDIELSLFCRIEMLNLCFLCIKVRQIKQHDEMIFFFLYFSVSFLCFSLKSNGFYQSRAIGGSVEKKEISDRYVFVWNSFDNFLSQNSTQHSCWWTHFSKRHAAKNLIHSIKSNLTDCFVFTCNKTIENVTIQLTWMKRSQLFGFRFSFHVKCDPLFHKVCSSHYHAMKLLDLVSFVNGKSLELMEKKKKWIQCM